MTSMSAARSRQYVSLSGCQWVVRQVHSTSYMGQLTADIGDGGTNRAVFTVVNPSFSKADLLERRLVSFAAAIVTLSSKPPRTVQGRHVCGQILRSGTAVAANYGEARGAESRADFIHKLKVVFKELNETTVWLEIIAQSSLLLPETTVALIAENRELCRILAASIKTARAAGE